MGRIRSVAAALLLLLFCAGCGMGKPYRELSMDQAPLWMEEHEDYLLVDVRAEEEFRSGHIPGAISVPLEELQAGHLEALPDPEQTLLIYCRTGRRAEEAAALLAEKGYRDLCAIGGFFDWKGETVTEEGAGGT